MKVLRKWMPVLVLIVLVFLLTRWKRETLCAPPASATAASIKAECDATGGTVVNGECTCPNGVI